MKKLILILLTALISLNINAQEKPCSSTEASQFDFWVGEWNLEWKNQNGETETGFNNITKSLGGCVIEENFTTGDKSFTGKSVSVYNPSKQLWQQTWVDNNGGYMDFTGGFSNGEMTLSRKAVNKTGKEVMQKMVFYNISKDEFWWNWESSTDDGKNWTLMWKIHYMRK